MSVEDQAVVLLDGVIGLFADRAKWTTRYLARNKGGRYVSPLSKRSVCWCGLGALLKLKVEVGDRTRWAYEAILDWTGRDAVTGYGVDLSGVNDELGYDAMMDVFSRAREHFRTRAAG